MILPTLCIVPLRRAAICRPNSLSGSDMTVFLQQEGLPLASMAQLGLCNHTKLVLWSRQMSVELHTLAILEFKDIQDEV